MLGSILRNSILIDQAAEAGFFLLLEHLGILSIMKNKEWTAILFTKMTKDLITEMNRS